jgi:hypothetical protein
MLEYIYNNYYNLFCFGSFYYFIYYLKTFIEKQNKKPNEVLYKDDLNQNEESNIEESNIEEKKFYECNYCNVIDMIPSNTFNRMLFYEEYSNKNINEVGYGDPYIVRLKGRNFKNIPLDMFQYLQDVAMQTMKEFHAQTAIVISNEIILVFSGDIKLDNNLFNGNTRRIGCILSSFASSQLSINTNIKCSFEASVIDFPVITNELKHFTFDYINYIKMKCNDMSVIGVNPVFIKRIIDKSERNDCENIPSLGYMYKYIKFTLDTVKANSWYNIFLTTSTFTQDSYNGRINFNKFYEMNQLIKS